MNVLNMKTTSGKSKLRAFFDLELDNGMILKGFKLAEGPEGLFVGMPSEKDKDGKYWDRVIVPKELKPSLNDLALKAYNRATGGGQASAPHGNEESDLPF